MISNGYSTLERAKGWLGIAGESEHELIERLVTGASRAIDEACRRRFYAATETRIYGARSSSCLRLDQDLLSVTTLKTDEDGDRTFEVTWATTDYYLLPRNAVVDGLPFDRIERDSINGGNFFPTAVPFGVEIVGSWGYCATGSHPALIEEACLLQVARDYARKSSPLGIQGSADVGFIRVTLDRDIQDKLWPFVREAVTA